MQANLALELLLKQTNEVMNIDENPVLEKITRTFDSLRCVLAKHENELKQKVRAIEKQNKDLAQRFQKELVNKQEELNKWNKELQNVPSTKESMNYTQTTTKNLNRMKSPRRTEYILEEIDELEANFTKTLQRVRIRKLKKSTPVITNTSSIQDDDKKCSNELEVYQIIFFCCLYTNICSFLSFFIYIYT